MSARDITVDVVYARPDRSWTITLRLPVGATVGDAIRAADLAAHLGMPPEVAGIAIHGRVAEEAMRLRDGDRVELLRPLRADPKQARRARAARPDRAG